MVEAVARPISGWLSDRLPVRKLYFYMVGCVGLGICNIAIPHSPTYAALVACMVFYGISSGIIYPLIAVLVREYSGVSRISGGLGWAFVFQGAGFLLGQPIAAATFIFVSVVVLLLLVPKKGKSWALESGKPAPDVPHDECDGVVGLQARQLPDVTVITEGQTNPVFQSWLYDATGNYDMSFYAAATFIFVSVVVLLLLVPKKGKSWALESGKPAPDVPHDECDGVVGLQARQLPDVTVITEGQTNPVFQSWLYDATGNYDMSFYAAATFIFVSVVVLLLLVPKKGKSWALESGKPAPDVPHDECDGVVGLQARQLPDVTVTIEGQTNPAFQSEM
uniref:Major facilitator superfamily (MFS) profile domain-containing protein n=1 Tax=Branchiostoma floridae TaxID=7739 RepID=C3ZEK9_BRAFL|eukprot:XP_002593154.1 hypothetical protein BRAFLDRAFT_72763 [Branchiostoma floridae]